MIPVIGLTLAALFFVSGWFAGIAWLKTSHPVYTEKEIRLTGYQFTKPLLECEPGDETIAGRELQPFRHLTEQFIEDKKRLNWAAQVSVYFRDLDNGLSFSISGEEKFAPASLLKVPLMMAYLKWAESSPNLLSQKVTDTLPGDLNAAQYFKVLGSIEYGKSYTVDELLHYMIGYSDNNAYFLLFPRINRTVLHKVYTDLGLALPKVTGPDALLSVEEYAEFYRILFNASYLSKEYSEKALAYLSEVDFKGGIVAGLPNTIVVAQKFGQRTLGARDEIKQLHDCGIVYYPNHPYLLCLMSSGNSFEQLDETLSGISRLVYQEVDRQYRE
jgi:beta-lactamase class A